MENKTLKLVRNGLVLVIALIALFFFIKVASNKDDLTGDAFQGAMNGMLYFTYIVLAAATLMAVFIWFAEMFTHPKKLVEFLISAGLFLFVVLIAKFALASNQAVQYSDKLKISASTSNWVDTGLYTFYILAVIAILAMILSPLLTGFGAWGSNKELEEIPLEDENSIEE